MIIQENLDSFSRAFARYAEVFRGTRKDALAHTASNFAGFAVQGLKAKQSPKGFIKSELEAHMKSHRGIIIHQSARDTIMRQYGVKVNSQGRKEFHGSKIFLGKKIKLGEEKVAAMKEKKKMMVMQSKMQRQRGLIDVRSAYRGTEYEGRRAQATADRKAARETLKMSLKLKKQDIKNQIKAELKYARKNTGREESFTALTGAQTKNLTDKGLQSVMAEQEIKMREAHRAFTASSFLFPGMRNKYGKGARSFYAGGAFRLGLAKLVDRGFNGDEFHFDFGSQVSRWSAAAATGLNKSSRKGVLDDALMSARNEMLSYIRRKAYENARAAAANISRL